MRRHPLALWHGRARTRLLRVLVVIVGGLTVATASGCGTEAEGRAAAAVALRFSQVGQADPGQACSLLSERARTALHGSAGSDCAAGLAALAVPVSSRVLTVTAAGHSAQVRLDRDTVFLGRFANGWQVTAAACKRASADPAVPYECDISGG